MEIKKNHITKFDDSILSKRTSYQINTWSSFSKEMTVKEVLHEIKSDIHKAQVLNLRNLLLNDKKEDYSSHKKMLPAVTFCGTFEDERKKSKIKTYNSIIVLDVDKLDEQELNRIKECFQKEPIVYAFWESPSKKGLKGLVPLNYNFTLSKDNIDRAHKGAFQKLATYFKKSYNIELDNSGSDTTRLCFFSFDPKVVSKEISIPFEINELDILPVVQAKEKNIKLKFTSDKDALFNPFNKNKPIDRYTIKSIITFLEKKKLSITDSYEEWYKVAMAIANSFTHEIGEKYFLKLSSLDILKFNEFNCKNFLLHCYESREGAVKFSSIVYLAKKKGYLKKNRGIGVLRR